jgi:hypothetical protein
MNKALCLALLLPCAAQASSGPETFRAGAANAFAAIGSFRLDAAPASAVPSKPAGGPVKAAASQYVQVSGNLTMNGNGNYTRGTSMVFVNFSGYAAVTDGTGRITSDSTWFNRNVSCTVSGGWVNCSDWPQWSVQFYKDGRYIGTVGGSLHASAYAPNGFFTATSYVSLSGDVMVTEP